MAPDARMDAPSSRTGRVARLVAGWTLLAAGAALLVLPGPGFPLVLGGLAILAREQPWAGRLHRRVHEQWARAKERARRAAEGSRRRDGGRSC